MGFGGLTKQFQYHSTVALRVHPTCAKLFSGVLALVSLIQVAAFSGSQVNVLSHSSSPMVAVRFTSSGGVLGVSEDGVMTMWSPDGQRVWNISLASTPRKYDYTRIKVRAMDVSADGRQATVAYLRSGVDRSSLDEKAEDTVKRKDTVWETHIVLIDTSNGAIKKDFDTVRDASVTTLLFTPSGKHVYVTTATPLARSLMTHQHPTSFTYVLSTDTGQVLRSFRSQGWIGKATLSPDGRRFAAAAFQRITGNLAFYELQVYDADAGELLEKKEFETTESAAIGFSLDGRRLAVSRSVTGGLEMDLLPKDEAGKFTHVITAPRFTDSRALAFTNNDRIVVTGGRLRLAAFDDVGTPRLRDQGGVVIVLDLRTGQKLRTSAFRSFVTCVAVSRDGMRVAAGMHDGRIAMTTIM